MIFNKNRTRTKAGQTHCSAALQSQESLTEPGPLIAPQFDLRLCLDIYFYRKIVKSVRHMEDHNIIAIEVLFRTKTMHMYRD